MGCNIVERIPQPSDTPYEVGDRVWIYLSDCDNDSEYHGLLCEVLADEPDNLGTVTGRELDSHHYRLWSVDTDTEIPVSFRHEDLVPESEWDE